jgi:chromosome segregation ATPase
MKRTIILAAIAALVIAPSANAFTITPGSADVGSPVFMTSAGLRIVNLEKAANELQDRANTYDAKMTKLENTQLSYVSIEDRLKEAEGSLIRKDETISFLSDQLRALRDRVTKLEDHQTVSTQTVVQSPGTTTVAQADTSDLESRVSTLERVVSMMEVNIGSIYQKIEESLAPIRKILKIK